MSSGRFDYLASTTGAVIPDRDLRFNVAIAHGYNPYNYGLRNSTLPPKYNRQKNSGAEPIPGLGYNPFESYGYMPELVHADLNLQPYLTFYLLLSEKNLLSKTLSRFPPEMEVAVSGLSEDGFPALVLTLSCDGVSYYCEVNNTYPITQPISNRNAKAAFLKMPSLVDTEGNPNSGYSMLYDTFSAFLPEVTNQSFDSNYI